MFTYNKFKPQVEKSSYYNKKYFTAQRFISYYYQIYLVLKTKAKSVFEIGVGDKTVSNYLKTKGHQVVTADFDSELKPDIVCDVRKIPCDNDSHETVIAYEILEHIPYHDFGIALSELKRISKEYVIISLPYNCSYIKFNLGINFFIKNRTIKKEKKLLVNYPNFFRKIDIKENGQHYWELGAKNYPLKKVKKELRKHFSGLDDYYFKDDPFHYYFILKK